MNHLVEVLISLCWLLRKPMGTSSPLGTQRGEASPMVGPLREAIFSQLYPQHSNFLSKCKKKLLPFTFRFHLVSRPFAALSGFAPWGKAAGKDGNGNKDTYQVGLSSSILILLVASKGVRPKKKKKKKNLRI